MIYTDVLDQKAPILYLLKELSLNISLQNFPTIAMDTMIFLFLQLGVLMLLHNLIQLKR